MKITFLGDIMCEPPIVRASRKKDGTYDFNGVFAQVKDLLAEADYVIANLETPLAGEQARYTQHHFSFNAPDALAAAMKNAGICLVSTANNHVFDRGYAGMKRTLLALDAQDLPHTGTFYPGSSRQEAAYFEVQDVKFAVVAYTYGTNYNRVTNPYLVDGEYARTVNLLMPQSMAVELPGTGRKRDWVDKTMRFLSEEQKARMKKRLGMVYNAPRIDDNLEPDTMALCIRQFQEDIRLAKQKADVVLVCPHTGGQFNPIPGRISKYVVEKAIEAGADAVIASHSHIVQKVEMRADVPCAFSLGNFSMSPASGFLLPENLPEYGLALHLYLEGGSITKVTFSILKAVEKKHTQLVSWPVDVLYEHLETPQEKALLEKHVSQIYETVTGGRLQGETIRREYDLKK